MKHALRALPRHATGIDPDPRLQVVRREDRCEGLSRGHLHRRPERVRQVQRGRRDALGPRRAEPEDPPWQQDGGRHLPRLGLAQDGGHGRGQPRLQQRRRPQRAVERGGGGPAAVPDRGERVPAQHQRVPPARRAGSLRGHRGQSQGLRAHGPGAPQPRADRQAVGAPPVHRGGGGHRPLQAAALRDPGQARRDAAQHAAAARRDGGGAAAALVDRAPGPQGPAVQGAPVRAAGSRPGPGRRRLRGPRRPARNGDARDGVAPRGGGAATGPGGDPHRAAGSPGGGDPGHRVPAGRSAPVGAKDPGRGRAPARAPRADGAADPGPARGGDPARGRDPRARGAAGRPVRRA